MGMQLWNGNDEIKSHCRINNVAIINIMLIHRGQAMKVLCCDVVLSDIDILGLYASSQLIMSDKEIHVLKSTSV